MFGRVVNVVIAVAAIAAAVISFNLTVEHITGSSGMAWFDAACTDSAEPGKNRCAQALSSPYAYIPPKDPAKPVGGVHFPVAFLGLLYYSVLFVWLAAIGRPSFSRRWLHAVPLIVVGIGLAFSAYFLNIMYRGLSELCPWCLVTHGLNLLIAIGLVLLWPRRRLSGSDPARVDSHPESAITAASLKVHPSGRLLATTVLAALFLVYGHFFHLGWREQRKNASDMMAELSVLRSNVGGYIAQWQLAQPCAITPRPDDAVRPFSKAAGDRAVLDIVIFSDFECPACARFARFFDKNVPQFFDQRLRVVFRHYPLDQSCNSGSVKTVHPHACEAAYLAEGARELGGAEAFWKAHDFLFEQQSETAAGSMTAERLASAIGLEAAALKGAANKATVMPRIAQDLEQVRACGLRATPGIYVDGRRIESAAASNIQFWDAVADWFWRERAKEARPPSTRTASATPTTPQGSSTTP